MKNRFTLRNVSKQFVVAGATSTPPIAVLKDVTIQFDQGEQYAIAGVSGTGKSTLLSLIGGIEHVTAGSVLFNDVEVHELVQTSPQRFFGKHVSMIFQVPHLINELSVLENILIRGMLAKQPRSESYDRATHLLEKVGLTDKAAMLPATLSLGEAQRVAVVRAFFSHPSFIIADEPTAHLDSKTRENVLDLLDDFYKDGGGLIVASHDPSVIERMHHVYDLREGSLVPRIERK